MKCLGPDQGEGDPIGVPHADFLYNHNRLEFLKMKLTAEGEGRFLSPDTNKSR